MRRTHRCGTLGQAEVGQQVCVMGWVHSRRDHGGVIFLDLRDRTGLVQVVADPQRGGAQAHATAEEARSEYVIAAIGTVVDRAPDLVNPRLATGAIEILASEITILNAAKHPPFEIDQTEIGLEQRMRYRYIDLRRPRMQEVLQIRHNAAKAARDYLSSEGFLEVETPLLMKATPEGARDFLVPCRLVPGTFYVLPQSPQLIKQTLMASGVDRYFQLARCLRDEDLRGDRQPEHTQIDIEMSFVEQDEVLEAVEGLMQAVFATVGIEVKTPFPRLTYQDAMARYGSDKPDTRFGLEFVDITDLGVETDFGVFKGTAAKGGTIKGFRLPAADNTLSRNDLDKLVDFSIAQGAKGLVWIPVTADGFSGNLVKYLGERGCQLIQERMGAGPGDMVFFVADQPKLVDFVLNRVRLKLGYDLGLVNPAQHNFLWVVDFPLFEQNAETGAIEPMHHPFSMPKAECLDKLESDPLAVTAQLYDLVLNGAELCSGSIRCHVPDIQLRILEQIGINREEAYERFGFLLEVFSYGAPPHGGVGLGFDRIVAILTGQDTRELDIREVIAFPKTSTGRDLMLGCPTTIDAKQLKEVGILKVVEPDEA